jgi:hypothetical protein
VRAPSSAAPHPRVTDAPRRCPPFVKRIRCFLRGAVVIGAQCIRFATALFRYRHLNHG